jgi:hypothetical protein
MLNPLTVRQELMERGLPGHVADGFVMNFQDESGLNPSINETAPLVQGSRGGFGLAQWTGPRRKALEQFASSVGKDVADPDVQYDFLMHELHGPESGAAAKIFSTETPGDAAAAIVQYFERPAPEHLASRAAKYAGASPEYGMNPLTQSGGIDEAQLNALIASLGQQQAPPPGPAPGMFDPAAALRAGMYARSLYS